MKDIVENLKTNNRIRQVIGLFSINIISIPIGIFTSIVITRYLGAKGYGDYKFIQSIFSLAISIFTFGFFQAGNRALVLNNDKNKAKEYYGTELIITGGIYVLMSLFLILYVIFDENLFDKGLDKFLLYVIPFGWVFLLNNYFETLFQADNKIRILGKVRLYPKIGFLLSVLLVFFVLMNIETNRLAVIYGLFFLSEIVVYLIIILKMNISFKNFKKRFREIWNYNKSFGLNVYIGSLVAVGFAQLTEILISYFGQDNSGVGFYSLALTFTLPLTFIPNTIATTHYKDFSSLIRVPKKLLFITIGLSLAALIFIWVLVPPFVTYFYGDEFKSVVWLNFIVSFGVLAYGFGDFFNRFLGANGQGIALRNSAFIVGLCTMILNLSLIPKWGASGAAYARLMSGFIYVFLMIIFYLRFTKRNLRKNNNVI